MIFVSLTRLRLRSVRFLPLFAIHAFRSQRQVGHAAGCLRVALLPDRRLTFWTMTAWESEAAMRAYMTSGAHKKAMPYLMHWCDEASVANWTQDDCTLLSWSDADNQMRTHGRPSKMHHPSAHHATLTYAAPRAG